MAQHACDAEYPIAAVSKLTGVSCHALRVWERRYGFPTPHRSPAGHRRYAHHDVEILKRVSDLCRSGRAIGELIAACRGQHAHEAEAAAPRAHPESNNAPDVRALLDALMAGDFDSAVVVFDGLKARLDPVDLAMKVVHPSLTETGERWYRRECSVFQERCVSDFMRRHLISLVDDARRRNVGPAHRVVIGAVQGDHHEGGVLVASLLLERAGWRTINLGVDLPVREFSRAVDAFEPDAVALSFALSRNINKRFEELAAIRRVPVFVGGRSILNYQTLARKHGLIPVLGAGVAALDMLTREFETVRARRPSSL